MVHLFSPLTIARVALKNRIVMASCPNSFAFSDGFLGDKLYSYYLERAHGGVGLIITESAWVMSPSETPP